MEVKAQHLSRGLKDVYFDTTQASFIDGQVGKLLYRGYNIHDLAEKSTFEEVVYLLLYGTLPNKSQLDQMDSMMRDNRALPKEIVEVLRLVKDSHPMDALRTGVSALASFDPDVSDKSVEGAIRKGLRLTAQSATLVATHHRLRQGLNPVDPDPSLNHAGNFLYMLFDKKPSHDEMKLMDVDFIIHAEHGPNASAFAVRVAASTVTDLHAAIVGGIGVLKGPAHGGAAESVMKMALEIGHPDNTTKYVNDLVENGGRVMGFGHRVYKVEDPRVRHLRDRAHALAMEKGNPEWFQILTRLEDESMKPLRAKGVFVNVDFYAGAIYYLLGIPEDLFIPMFALGRIPGWTLQCMEQYSNNILIRPLAEYTGSMDLEYVPFEDRL